MNKTRIDQLLFFLKEEPNDPFNIYALAIEYQKHDIEKAIHYFETLLSDHENYIPTYYHAAKLYAEIGNRLRADEIYRKGIDKAKGQNEMHALRELKSAWEEFSFEEDD